MFDVTETFSKIFVQKNKPSCELGYGKDWPTGQTANKKSKFFTTPSAENIKPSNPSPTPKWHAKSQTHNYKSKSQTTLRSDRLIPASSLAISTPARHSTP
jgi:hypothetical protein